MWQLFVKIVQASLRTQALCHRQRQRNYFIWMMPADTSLLILRMISGLRKCCCAPRGSSWKSRSTFCTGNQQQQQQYPFSEHRLNNTRKHAYLPPHAYATHLHDRVAQDVLDLRVRHRMCLPLLDLLLRRVATGKAGDSLHAALNALLELSVVGLMLQTTLVRLQGLVILLLWQGTCNDATWLAFGTHDPVKPELHIMQPEAAARRIRLASRCCATPPNTVRWYTPS